MALALVGVAPHLMVTDPPYGVEYDPAWRNRYQEAVGQQPTYKRSVGVVGNDDRTDWREAWALFPGDVAYIWHAGKRACRAPVQALGQESGRVRYSSPAGDHLGPQKTVLTYRPQRLPLADERYLVCRSALARTHQWRAIGPATLGGGSHQSTAGFIPAAAPGNHAREIATTKTETGHHGHGTQKPEIRVHAPADREQSQRSARRSMTRSLAAGTTMIAAEMTGPHLKPRA